MTDLQDIQENKPKKSHVMLFFIIGLLLVSFATLLFNQRSNLFFASLGYNPASNQPDSVDSPGKPRRIIV